MCESCSGGGLDRREFLKIGGSTAAFGSFGATTILAQTINGAANVLPGEGRKTNIAVLFMYPPANVVNEGRLEDSWAPDQWFTYPGNQFEPEMNQEKYAKKISEFAQTYGMDINFQGVVYTRAALADFIAKTKAAPPDTLLVVNFWNTFSQWVLEMSQQLAPLSMIVYHPVGSNHQLPPRGLMTAPNMVYIHSLENWEALENAMSAANAKKMVAQSRLLRVSDAQEPVRDKNLGVEIVSIPATEYNDLFDSIEADDVMIREAMAFKAKATSVINVEDRYFVEGFRARKTVNEIMKRYGADGITIRCLMLKERKPCIAFSLNNGALIPCACEDASDSAMSMMIGTHLFKRGGFQHNPEFDVDRNQYYGAHCTCALELNGPGKGGKPFRIRPFTHQLPKTAAIDVQMTPGEKVFLMKYIPPQNRIVAYTGTMVGSPEINTAGGCATRFVMDVDKVDDVCSIYQGPHPILYCGSVMEAKRIKAFAKLAKLEFLGNV